MEIVEGGGGASATMVDEMRKKQKIDKKLTIDVYLDFIHDRTLRLTVSQLRKIISMHGFKKLEAKKGTLIDIVTTMDLMDLHRSTLQDGGVSGGAGLTLEEVTNDLKNLDWQECHVTSLVTVGAIVPATSVSSEGGTAPVKRESAKERHVTSDLVNEHAIVPAASASTVSVKRKTKKKHQVTSLTTEGAIIPAGGGCTVPVKLKKAKERLESSLRTEDAVVPAVASTEGGTVPAKRKKAKARLVSSLVTEGAAVPAVSTSSEGGGTVAAKRKRPKGLGMKATKAAGVDHSVVSAGTTVAAGSTTEG